MKIVPKIAVLWYVLELLARKPFLLTDDADGNLRYDLHTTGPNGTSAGVTVASTKSSGFSELRQNAFV